MAVAYPPPLVPIAGASDREGRISAQPAPLVHWIAPSRGINPIFLFLIIAALMIAAPQGFFIVPFSESLQYSNAKPIQADDGSDRHFRPKCSNLQSISPKYSRGSRLRRAETCGQLDYPPSPLYRAPPSPLHTRRLPGR